MTGSNYEIVSSQEKLGGGWQLRLLEDDVELFSKLFPIDQAKSNFVLAILWWNKLTADGRKYWRTHAPSDRICQAYRLFLLAEAYAEAELEAYAWLDSREA